MSSESENIDYKETLNVTRTHSAAAREKDIPESKANESFPLWALVGFGAILMVAGSFWGKNGQGLSNMTFVNASHEQLTPDAGGAGGVEEELTPEEAWFKKGKSIFKVKGACAGCHQTSGLGTPGQIPPLVDSEWVIKSDERLVMALLHGINGQLVVKGVPYNGNMPAVGQTLNDVEIAQLASYIRNEWGNSASYVSEEEVKFAREKYKDQRGSFTQGDLEAVPENQMLEGADFGA